jgi:two-component system, response regulator
MEGMMSSGVDILIVEDNPDDLALVLRALRHHNLAEGVEVAMDGAEALDFLFCLGAHAQRCIEDCPKLILLDLKLPKISGLEVVQRLKADPRTRPIPVVIFTSSAQERDVMESYRLGVNSYVVKPLHLSELTEALGQIGRYWLGLNQPTGG